ncbi:MAG TPA: tetratricopeptide repeat protein [Pyrinomonadaceae bacterium]|jgi:tetratricopeptide (TPR) repeat protein|nr:tetratricopeptide repeat protein [Pyrinomonadaceae bacterium]
MSDPSLKGVKRTPARPASRHSSTSSQTKNRTLAAAKSSRPKPLVKRTKGEKAPARKATQSSAASSAKSKQAQKTGKSAATRKAAPAKAAPVRPATSKTTTIARSKTAGAARKTAAPAKQPTRVAPKKSAPVASKSRTAPPKATASQTARKHAAPPTHVPRQPTIDEAAALRAFERAHKEFARGHFGEARNQFRALIERYARASEVTARARTYLAIAEARLRTESTLPRDADSLYDRGVIELNRGDYVAAQELFERALKREPEAAHIHYGLAATRARLGSINSALESLRHALGIQPNLRVRAQHDPDLSALRNDPDYEQLVFATRF